MVSPGHMQSLLKEIKRKQHSKLNKVTLKKYLKTQERSDCHWEQSPCYTCVTTAEFLKKTQI